MTSAAAQTAARDYVRTLRQHQDRLGRTLFQRLQGTERELERTRRQLARARARADRLRGELDAAQSSTSMKVGRLVVAGPARVRDAVRRRRRG